MKSTIAQARSRFDSQVLPRVSDHRARELRTVLDEAEAQARTVASQHVAQHEARIQEMRQSALQELTAVRDAYDDLAPRAGMPAGEFSAQLRDLRHRQQRAEGQLTRAEEIVALIEGVEADPVAWFDGLSERFPAARITREWSW